MLINTVELDVELTRKNLNRTILAEKAELDRATVYRIFNGGDCTISTAKKIVQAVGMSATRASYIFFGIESHKCDK